ncbi:hydroxymethylbilane synthase [Candidatus Pelagibacter sp.]|nr:hydroxymethylbilane synthase [Candidatus Pelagibacter sp.]
MKKKIIIGSRGSKLALIYAERAKTELLRNPQIESIEIKHIITSGDTIVHTRLSEHGGKGLFCKKIEIELLNKNIDIAVHALKDMPITETDQLLTNCFLERSNPKEILISNDNKNIKDLKPNAIVGTSSFRREFQLKNIRKDLNFKLIRGNVDTRIKKLNDKVYDAIILSYAGIKALGLEEKISQTFSTSEIIPSAGQGVVALQCRQDDHDLIDLLNKINHQQTHNCIKAERNVLKILEGDCETAVGAFAEIANNKINLEAELFSLDGSKRFHYKLSKDLKFAHELGKQVGEILKRQSNNSYKK